ncbi:hypothetical protein LY76DRAFT_44525 [Colletotrichum caudatum]|nr:hypothetical protein LY76DRAFT_44525 [Colletotrichum caudatum]
MHFAADWDGLPHSRSPSVCLSAIFLCLSLFLPLTLLSPYPPPSLLLSFTSVCSLSSHLYSQPPSWKQALPRPITALSSRQSVTH